MTEQSTGGPTSATPFWFGPDDRPLLGWLHLPADGMARGGVVLCQPLGIEAICVYFSYRMLADRLAQLGLAVLRFDYDGTGDSVGAETDPDRLESWLASLTLATDRLAATGVGAVGMVGIRMGALLAATEAVRRGGVDRLVLWDPCLSGRAFLREQRFLRLLATEGDGKEDTAVEAPGIRFEAETVKELGDLDMTRTEGPLAARTLVLAPPGRSHPRRLEARLAGTPVEWQEATGQEDLLDSQLQETPFDTIERVALWLSAGLDAPPVRLSPPDTGSAAVARGADGHVVSERPVALGALPLFGLVTEPAGPVESPTIVLVDEGNTHHIGQSRVWVDLARRLGGEGFRVLRFDLSGNGDSGTRPGQLAHVARAPEAGDDVWQAQRAISPDDPVRCGADRLLLGGLPDRRRIADPSDPGHLHHQSLLLLRSARGERLVATAGPTVEPALVRDPGHPAGGVGLRPTGSRGVAAVDQRSRHRDLAGGRGQSPRLDPQAGVVAGPQAAVGAHRCGHPGAHRRRRRRHPVGVRAR